MSVQDFGKEIRSNLGATDDTVCVRLERNLTTDLIEVWLDIHNPYTIPKSLHRNYNQAWRDVMAASDEIARYVKATGQPEPEWF